MTMLETQTQTQLQSNSVQEGQACHLLVCNRKFYLLTESDWEAQGDRFFRIHNRLVGRDRMYPEDAAFIRTIDEQYRHRLVFEPIVQKSWPVEIDRMVKNLVITGTTGNANL